MLEGMIPVRAGLGSSLKNVVGGQMGKEIPFPCDICPGYDVSSIIYFALDSKVLLVAGKRVDGWAAYAGAVPGINHEREKMIVWKTGTKMGKKAARFFFHQFKGLPYAD